MLQASKRRRNTSKRAARKDEGAQVPKKGDPRVRRGHSPEQFSYSHELKTYFQVARVALASRLLTLALCVLFDYLLLDFDSSTSLHWPTCYSDLGTGDQPGAEDLTVGNLSQYGETTTWGLDTSVHVERGDATIVRLAKARSSPML